MAIAEKGASDIEIELFHDEWNDALEELTFVFANKARESTGHEDKQRLNDLAIRSLKLIIPDRDYKHLLPDSRLDLIAQTIAITGRDIERDRRLDAALDAIDAAIAENDPLKANDIRLRLLTDFPELAANGQMDRRINAASR